MTSLVAQMVKHLPTMWETQIQSLGQEDLLEKEMATHSSILAWKIPWMEEPGRPQSMGSDSRTQLSHFTFLFTFLAIKRECIWTRYSLLNKGPVSLSFRPLFSSAVPLLVVTQENWMCKSIQKLINECFWRLKCPNVHQLNKMCHIHPMQHSVQFSHSLVSDFVTPWITARQASLSITTGVDSNSCPSSQWYHPAISSTVVPFSSCPQLFSCKKVTRYWIFLLV